MRKFLLCAVAIGLGTAALAGNAHAYQVTMQTANTNGTAFNADKDGTFASAATGTIASASFTYIGPLSFNIGPPQNSGNTGDLNSAFFSPGTITNYTPGAHTSTSAPSSVNFATLSSFLGSSGSAANFAYGSLLTFDLGTLAAGTVLTITHDDGASVYQGNAMIGSTVVGPTTAFTDTVTLTSSGDTVIYYARENGSPSVLNVAVPEPASLALVGAGLAAVGFARRRRTA